jgi:hypothetical protein
MNLDHVDAGMHTAPVQEYRPHANRTCPEHILTDGVADMQSAFSGYIEPSKRFPEVRRAASV